MLRPPGGRSPRHARRLQQPRAEPVVKIGADKAEPAASSRGPGSPVARGADAADSSECTGALAFPITDRLDKRHGLKGGLGVET